VPLGVRGRAAEDLTEPDCNVPRVIVADVRENRRQHRIGVDVPVDPTGGISE